MDIVSTNNVCKSFGTHCALNNLSINVAQGSIYGLLGPNGAGKTTLIRIINQIIAPDSGEVFFKNKTINPADVANIGYLPEERGLYKKMKVGEQAVYLARLKGLSRHDTMKRLKYWFEKFEMQAWWDKKVEELSKGMAQKVQFVTTILHEPELLIFDEPFSGFDPINASMLKNEILELKARGATIIFSTHNMASVEELCDYITLIDKSQAVLTGPLNGIREQFKKNIYEIQFAGNANNFELLVTKRFELINIATKNGSNIATVKALPNCAQNELLKLVVPDFHIIAYREVLPGMDEVFISAVNRK